jgi:hypothetical protein
MIRVGNGILDRMSCSHGVQFQKIGNGNSSYINNSSFDKGYGCALGIDGSNSIKIYNNIFFHSGSNALAISGASNVISQNLVLSTRAKDTLFKLVGDSVVAEDNFLVGLPFIFKGDVCLNYTSQITSGGNHSVKRNTVYGNSVVLNGPDLMYGMYDDWPCIRASEFTVFRSKLYGLIYKGFSSFQADSNTLIDCQVGVYAVVMGPVSTTHEVGNKKSLITNSLFIGQSPVYNCSEDVAIKVFKSNKDNICAGPKYDAKVGVVWSQFMDLYRSLWTLGL